MHTVPCDSLNNPQTAEGVCGEGGMGSSVTGDGQGTALKVEGRKKCRVQVNTQQNRRQEKSGESRNGSGGTPWAWTRDPENDWLLWDHSAGHSDSHGGSSTLETFRETQVRHGSICVRL